MNTNNLFNVSGKGTEKQKREFEQRKIQQDEKYREFELNQIDDVLEQQDIRQMMRDRDHEMKVKRELDVEIIEREIDAQLMKSDQPKLENTPKTPGGSVMSNRERTDSIRRSTRQLMEPEFERENSEMLKAENKKIDEAIEHVLMKQEQSESMGYDESLHL